MNPKLKIYGQPLPNMPWEERPESCHNVMWRYSGNPVIPRDLLPTSNSIFNSAVVPFGDGYAGVFRCDDTNRRMVLHVGFSADGNFLNNTIHNTTSALVKNADIGFAGKAAVDARNLSLASIGTYNVAGTIFGGAAGISYGAADQASSVLASSPARGSAAR